ncbi:two-component regulator propeller domain-containing protein, partial [Catalinimonas sp. 4WD22]|uniref:ligand-binding sensor domain-containing protein n=1 Tax=Catalinimonas locisalis TaxID=3133978 RepID=UPI003100E391
MKTRLIVTPLIFLWLYLFSVTGYGQDKEFYFEHITTEDGLSHNSVQSIYQDREGFMWFGTAEGLNKYDGYDFTVYRPDPNNPEHSLTHNVPRDIYEDNKGRLWIATFGGGLNLIDKQSGMVKSFNVNPTNIPEWNVFFSIFEDQEGMLWLGNGLGVVQFDPVREEFTLLEYKGFFFADIIEDASHRLWAAGRGGLYQLDRQSGIFTPIPVDTGLNKQPDCSKLYLDQDGLLWIGTNGEGIFKLDTQQDTVTVTKVKLKGVDTNPSLFNRIIEGGNGYLWIASANGLYRFNKETSETLNITTNQQVPGSLSHYYIGDVFKDRDGNIWVGTENGLNILRHHTKKFNVYQLSPALPSQPLFENNINRLLQDHTGKIWLSSSGSIASGGNYVKGLYSFDRKTHQFQHYSAAVSNSDSLTSNDVTALYIDKKKRLWVGTIEALHLYDSTSNSFKRFYTEIPVWHIHEDPAGKIWIAGNGFGKDGEFVSHGGFATFNPEQEKFGYYFYDPEDTIGLKSHCVSGLTISDDGNIWVGSFSHGFLSFDPKTDSYTHYLASARAKQGELNDKDVEVLYEDERGTLWVGTNQGGLHKFDPLNETFTFYTIEDGLASNHIVSIIADEHERLWIGTNQGLSCFDPTTEKFKSYNTSDGLPSDVFSYNSAYAIDGELLFGTDNGFVIFDPDSIQDNTTMPPVYITGF